MGSSWYAIPNANEPATGLSVDDIKARLKREPLVVLALVVPVLALLVQLGIGIPAGAIVAVQTFISSVAVIFVRGQVTPELSAKSRADSSYVNGYAAGLNTPPEATCP